MSGRDFGVAFQDEWSYSIHRLGHIYSDDVNSARFMWKTIPAAIKESRPEVVAVWRIGQRLWTRDYAGVYEEAIRGFNWSPEARGLVESFAEVYIKKMFRLLSSAYSTIGLLDAARFLGTSEEDTANYVTQQGWLVDASSKMLMAMQQAATVDWELDARKLQRLTEFVFHLEH